MIERETISAHEINKYDYCPYQWYYERLYGRAELRRLYAQRNARLHLEDSMSANFRKGEGYHQRSYFLLRLRRMAWKIAVLLFAAAAFGGYVWVKYSGKQSEMASARRIWCCSAWQCCWWCFCASGMADLR